MGKILLAKLDGCLMATIRPELDDVIARIDWLADEIISKDELHYEEVWKVRVVHHKRDLITATCINQLLAPLKRILGTEWCVGSGTAGIEQLRSAMLGELERTSPVGDCVLTLSMMGLTYTLIAEDLSTTIETLDTGELFDEVAIGILYCLVKDLIKVVINSICTYVSRC